MHCEEVDNVGRRGGAQRTNAGQLADLGCEVHQKRCYHHH